MALWRGWGGLLLVLVWAPRQVRSEGGGPDVAAEVGNRTQDASTRAAVEGHRGGLFALGKRWLTEPSSSPDQKG